MNSYNEFIANWKFLLEGLEKVRQACPENIPDVTNDEYFKTLLTLATQPELGKILILTNCDGKPLGFIVLIDITGMFQRKTLNVYIAYSNNKCHSTMKELVFESETWARKNKFKKVQALSYRAKTIIHMNGTVRRHFRQALGLNERCVVFEKEL